jgi:uncharacterized membrane protein
MSETFDRLHRLLPPKPEPPINPALVKHAEKRAKDAQERVAAITRFAGSMTFVYLHVI